MSTAKFPFPTSPIATEQQLIKTAAVASSPTAVKTFAAQTAAKKASAVKPAAKKTSIAKTPEKSTAKPSAKVSVKTAVRSAVKAPVKPPTKAPAKSAAKPLARKVTAKKVINKLLLSGSSTSARVDKSARADKLEKARKPKLVRDSFTIPKAEYVVLDQLKQRATALTRPAKKSELLRAGIKALAALSDAAFLTALAQVPAIKTGRPGSVK